MDKHFALDTNVLLDFPEVINQHKIVILSGILRELEKHKISRNGDLAYRARRATRFIDNNLDRIKFDFRDYTHMTHNPYSDKNYMDNQIIEACTFGNQYGLITNDILLKHKALAYGVDFIEVKEKNNDDYKGYKIIEMSNDELGYFYENLNKNIYDLLTNQYLILQQNKQTIDKLKWNGNKHVALNLPPKRYIKPLDDLQACTIDLLNDNSVPIKIIAGNYGSGKTFLNVKMALFHVKEKGHYAKMMVVRNPIGSGEEIGFLTGDKDKKTEGFFKPIIQHLDGGEQEARAMEINGQLIKEIPFYMKGLTIDDTFLLVDEAEDLTPGLIKLIGTRLGKNSVIGLSGDYQQSEDKYKRDNGLIKAIKELKGDPLVGIMVLSEDVRSEASKVFAKL